MALTIVVEGQYGTGVFHTAEKIQQMLLPVKSILIDTDDKDLVPEDLDNDTIVIVANNTSGIRSIDKINQAIRRVNTFTAEE